MQDSHYLDPVVEYSIDFATQPGFGPVVAIILYGADVALLILPAVHGMQQAPLQLVRCTCLPALSREQLSQRLQPHTAGSAAAKHAHGCPHCTSDHHVLADWSPTPVPGTSDFIDGFKENATAAGALVLDAHQPYMTLLGTFNRTQEYDNVTHYCQVSHVWG